MMVHSNLDIVVLEEHYADPHLEELSGRRLSGPVGEALLLSVDDRLARLDQLGIATEVLALNPPGLQAIADHGIELAQGVNNRLHSHICQVPTGRLAGFAALPTHTPELAADELERCCKELRFVGAMIHGPDNGIFLDDARFEPVFARAEALDVPIYLHPSELMPAVLDAYFEPYVGTHPMFARAGWGYTIETGTHAIRLVLSGLFERHPNLKIILGHLGETIPFLMQRIDEALRRDTPMKNFREVFHKHFYVTTSGFFSDNAVQCVCNEMGKEKVLFSIDAPYASSKEGVSWLRNLVERDANKVGIAGTHARALLGI